MEKRKVGSGNRGGNKMKGKERRIKTVSKKKE